MSDATPPVIDQSALDALSDPVGFHNTRVFPVQKQIEDLKRYSNYLTLCANAKLSIDAGRAAASTWPPIPFEVGTEVSSDAGLPGLKYPDTTSNGPRTLDQVDPAYVALPAPPDEIGTPMKDRPQGVIDIGANQVGGDGQPTAYFSVGPKDTWPAGVATPVDGNGHTYIKFSWAGMAYKYMRLS